MNAASALSATEQLIPQASLMLELPGGRRQDLAHFARDPFARFLHGFGCAAKHQYVVVAENCVTVRHDDLAFVASPFA